MAGVTASLTTIGLDEAITRLGRLSGFEMAGLADDAGSILESSTRGRFDSRLAPDGTEWVPWSEAYDETRHHGVHSLLVESGRLRDSIASMSTGAEVMVGARPVYAAHHQFGGDEIGSGIPARPYLGVSDSDAHDLRAMITGVLAELVQ